MPGYRGTGALLLEHEKAPLGAPLAHPGGPQWIHEIKHDGRRIIACTGGNQVRLWSRNGRDWSKQTRMEGSISVVFDCPRRFGGESSKPLTIPPALCDLPPKRSRQRRSEFDISQGRLVAFLARFAGHSGCSSPLWS
jgi:hypothetical protein